MKKFIIDVGASHDGIKTIPLKPYFNCPIIFIEPDVNALSKVFAGPDDIKLDIAITSYDGEIEFNFYQDGTHSVLETNIDEIHKYIDGYTGLPAEKEKWTAWKKEKVKCFTLKTLIESLGIEKIPYLKIDTQGHDFEVIKSLSDKINIVDMIECEVQTLDFELYKGQSKKEEIIKYLLENNFLLININSSTYGQEEDLIFKRRD